jgi:pyruvate dehydrogenase E1 component
MSDNLNIGTRESMDAENREWLDSLDYVYRNAGSKRVLELLRLLQIRSQEHGVHAHFTANTPYLNTIPVDKQPVYPGSRDVERRIKSIIRWNAMAMVVRANRVSKDIGGHISTYASVATLYEVGFNHFFRAEGHECGGDLIYFQGHSTPGIYARSFLEGRLTEKHLENFRQELRPESGLSSYPHPWLMPKFWQFPTVSMGLSSIMAIYQARFDKYLIDRGEKEDTGQKIWTFLGDGELDEPESLGAITLPPRERLDNLIFVINCNLQRLDGPVRGNGKIIQELEAAFRGAGWNVIKVIWGSEWDTLLENDKDGLLIKRMDEAVDGDYQKYKAMDGAFIREFFFGAYEPLRKLVEKYSDEQIFRFKRGGHDPEKVYTAYKAAVEYKGPTVILAKTVKGYGLGEAGEGKNISHVQKKLNEDEMREFRNRFDIPISDKDLAEAPFYKPDKNGPEMEYLHERRKALGGYMPERSVKVKPIKMPPNDVFEEFYTGSKGREVATTMAFVQLFAKLLNDKEFGKYIVPIVPDEARTFGMEALFRKVGIYSRAGQLYEPVDSESLLYYKEAKDGAILEEGITEAGAMSSFIAAATSYATHSIIKIPFFIFYSMFGFQRVGDLIWAAGDMQAKGFLIGGTAGRTTLAGEGLQHQDGNSHVLAYPVPNLRAYDPAFAYEIAVIVKDGIHRMYEKQENIFYYLSIMNETYPMPPMPKGAEAGILKGMYRFQSSGKAKTKQKVVLLGSGTILNEVVKARDILEEKYNIPADVWSVTSYKELYKDALDTERWNMLHPDKKQKETYINQCFKESDSVYIAASDYIKALPLTIAKWIPGRFEVLGTDGYGRSDGREALRDFFEVNAGFIVLAAVHALAKDNKVKPDLAEKVISDMGIDSEKSNPLYA